MTAPERARSAATELVDLAHADYDLGMSTDGVPFAVPRTAPRLVRLLRDGGAGSLRATLAAAYYATTGRIAHAPALADALLALEGEAQRAERVPLHLRVADHEDGVVIDLGDSTGSAVRVTPDGWDVLDEAPVLFRRTALTGALPVPERGGCFDDLWQFVNVAETFRPVLAGVLVSALLPDMPHPVLSLTGEQGTGKSTTASLVVSLIDPSPVPLRKPPRDGEGWVTAAAGSWVVALDNLSGLPDWLSDSLCRAVTGDGDVRRRLYSDSDLSVFAFRRQVIVNGIDLGSLRDDLAERLVTVTLDRIVERRDDRDVRARWASAHPRLLGALLDLTAAVLRERPRVVLDRPPRMSDYARVLAAVDHVLGTDGLSTYLGLARDLAVDAVTGDPVLAAIVEHVPGEWIGTATDLLALLGADDGHAGRSSREWPRTPRTMTGVLTRRAPALRRLGWVVDNLGRGGHGKTVRFRLVPPDAGDSAGNARTTPAPDGRDARMPAPALTCEDVLFAGDAGVAGVDPPSPSSGNGGGNTPHVVGAVNRTPATPATPAGGTPGIGDRHRSPASPATPATVTAGVTCLRCGDPLDPALHEATGDRFHATCAPGYSRGAA